MSELVTKSVAQEPQKQKIETRIAVEHIPGFSIVATAVTVLAILVAAVVFAQGQDQDKYSAEIAERNRVLRLQGIRGLVGGVFRRDQRNTQGHRRQSDDD